MMLRTALLLYCALQLADARAGERYALLVGVGQMPALPASHWLDGPPRDLAAMRGALLTQGFSAHQIQTLGAIPGQQSTRAAILASLARLASRAAPGDVVLLYWSGHGVLRPGFPGQQLGPLGHGVHLLTQDSAPTAGSRRPAGGVASAELGRAIDAIAARRAQVVAIFDTCHAAGSTRGAPEALVWRGLAPHELRWNHSPARETPTPAQPRPGFVGFFAAEAQQRSAESRSVIPGQASGLFTRALIGALHDSPASYQSWAGATAQRYRQVLGEYRLPVSRWPSPVFAGALDTALWHSAPASAVWLVRRDAHGWYLPYGQLDGVRTGDQFEREGVRWKVEQVGWGEARLSQVGAQSAEPGWASRIGAAHVHAPTLTLRRAGAMHAATLRLHGGTQVRAHVKSGQIPALRSQAGRIADLMALPAAPGQPFVDAQIELRVPGKPARRLAFADGDLGPLPVGTRIRVIIENRGTESVDLAIAHLPLTGAPARIFPAFAADSNRLPPGIAPSASRFERHFEVTGPHFGPEWLALVAAPVANGAMPRRFDLLATLTDVPISRGDVGPVERHADSAQLARLRWTSIAPPLKRQP